MIIEILVIIDTFVYENIQILSPCLIVLLLVDLYLIKLLGGKASALSNKYLKLHYENNVKFVNSVKSLLIAYFAIDLFFKEPFRPYTDVATFIVYLSIVISLLKDYYRTRKNFNK